MSRWAGATDGKTTVLVDTHITTDLRIEAAARELVHCINTMRKKQGLSLSDRVVFKLFKAPLLYKAAVLAHKDMICRETLADEIQVDVDGRECETIGLMFDKAEAHE